MVDLAMIIMVHILSLLPLLIRKQRLINRLNGMGHPRACKICTVRRVYYGQRIVKTISEFENCADNSYGSCYSLFDMPNSIEKGKNSLRGTNAILLYAMNTKRVETGTCYLLEPAEPQWSTGWQLTSDDGFSDIKCPLDVLHVFWLDVSCSMDEWAQYLANFVHHRSDWIAELIGFTTFVYLSAANPS